MRRNLVVGNWKMHGSKAQIRELVKSIKAGITEIGEKVEVGLCPTYLHIDLVADLIKTTRIKLGAQNAYPKESGAFTGEVSVSMLTDYGVSFVLVGHSERREMFGDSDTVIATKFLAAQNFGLQPILCVGESLQQRQQNATAEVILGQRDAVIRTTGIGAIAKSVVAYEPVWAIGTGQSATPDQAQEVHKLIREYLAAKNTDVARQTRIIYGGSVTAANAKKLFEQADIDGGLVGGASLQAEEFISICKSAG